MFHLPDVALLRVAMPNAEWEAGARLHNASAPRVTLLDDGTCGQVLRPYATASSYSWPGIPRGILIPMQTASPVTAAAIPRSGLLFGYEY